MAYASAQRVENRIAEILALCKGGFGTAITERLPHPVTGDGAIAAARIESGMEILRAIAANPQNGYYGSLSALVTLVHNQFLPAHDGEPGIPRIVPFAGADAIEGIPADPDEIDSYRRNPASFTGALDGVVVEHDQASADGKPSPVSGKYSLMGSVFKFTGLTAQIPLIQLTRSMADTGIPENYEPTLIKLSIPKLVQAGDKAAYMLAGAYGELGHQDLLQIQNGSMVVKPLPNLVMGQKAV